MDPSVKKILNNGFVIASLAPLLAAKSHWGPIKKAATELAIFAEAYRKLLTGFAPIDTDGWNGCEQGQLILRWIDASEDTRADSPVITPEDVDGIVTQMDEWTAAIRGAITDIVVGKLPT